MNESFKIKQNESCHIDLSNEETSLKSQISPGFELFACVPFLGFKLLARGGARGCNLVL